MPAGAARPATEGARGQGDARVPRQDRGVFVEGLVEVTETVEEDRTGMLRLQIEILPARGNEVLLVRIAPVGVLGTINTCGPGAGHGRSIRGYQGGEVIVVIGCQRGNATLCLIPRNHTSRRRSRGAWVNGHERDFVEKDGAMTSVEPTRAVAPSTAIVPDPSPRRARRGSLRARRAARS